MPIWVLALVKTAAMAMLEPLVKAAIRSIFDPKAVAKMMIIGGEKLVKSTETDIDDEIFQPFKESLERELDKELAIEAKP